MGRLAPKRVDKKAANKKVRNQAGKLNSRAAQGQPQISPGRPTLPQPTSPRDNSQSNRRISLPNRAIKREAATSLAGTRERAPLVLDSRGSSHGRGSRERVRSGRQARESRAARGLRGRDSKNSRGKLPGAKASNQTINSRADSSRGRIREAEKLASQTLVKGRR